MPFIPATNVAKVEMLHDQYGSVVENVYHVLNPDAWTLSTLLGLAATFQSWEEDTASPLRTDETDCFLIRVVDLTTATSPGVEVPISPVIGGGNAAPGMPGNVTASVKSLTDLRGRSYRGRTYFIGLAENQCTGNDLLAVTRDAIVDAYTTLAASITGEGYEMVVLSLYSGVDVDGKPIPRDEGVATPITSFSMDTDLDSQRRRLKNRGT